MTSALNSAAATLDASAAELRAVFGQTGPQRDLAVQGLLQAMKGTLAVANVQLARSPRAQEILQAVVRAQTPSKLEQCLNDFRLFLSDQSEAMAEALRPRVPSSNFGNDEHSLHLKASGLRIQNPDGSVQVISSKQLPPVLSLEDVLHAWDQTSAVPQSSASTLTTPSSSRSISSVRHAVDHPPLPPPPKPILPSTDSSKRFSDRPLPPTPQHQRSASASARLIKVPDNNVTSYDDVTYRTNKYKGGFASLLASYSAAVVSLKNWLVDLEMQNSVVSADALITGRTLVERTVARVADLMTSMMRPSPIVDQCTDILRTLFTTLVEEPATAKPEYVLPGPTKTKLQTAIFVLVGSVKGAIALNVLLHRYSIYLDWKAKIGPGAMANMGPDQVKRVFKLMVVGHGGVGKTSLVQRFTTGATSAPPPTQGIELKICKFSMDNEAIELQILDATGHRVLRDTFEQIYTIVDGVFIVYDVTDSSSFGDIHDWMHDLDKYSFQQRIIVANKIDQADRREIPVFRGQNLAEEYKVQHLETSCTANVNVEETVKTMILLIQHAQNIKGDGNDDSDDEADNYTNVNVSQQQMTTISAINITRLRAPNLPSAKTHQIWKVDKYTFFTAVGS